MITNNDCSKYKLKIMMLNYYFQIIFNSISTIIKIYNVNQIVIIKTIIIKNFVTNLLTKSFNQVDISSAWEFLCHLNNKKPWYF